MNTSRPQAFVNQFLVWLLVTIGFSGSIGLGTVWMRHEISVTANANRLIEARIADVQRHIDETLTAIEGEKGSDVLRQRNTQWHLGLVSAPETHLVHVTEDPLLRLARRHNLDLFNDRAPVVTLAMKD